MFSWTLPQATALVSSIAVDFAVPVSEQEGADVTFVCNCRKHCSGEFMPCDKAADRSAWHVSHFCTGGWLRPGVFVAWQHQTWR